MFYADFVLAKKGPLARVWLAAHWDKKLTKAQVFETNIEKSVDGILQPKVKMALRTSGHLLLGVVRIYSRKAKYLLADCNEAFVKIKMAFRPGMVDLPDDAKDGGGAVTLPQVFHDFDASIPELADFDLDFNLIPHRLADITMPDEYVSLNMTNSSIEINNDFENMSFGPIDLGDKTPRLRDDSEMDHTRFMLKSSDEFQDFAVVGDFQKPIGDPIQTDEDIIMNDQLNERGAGQSDMAMFGSDLLFTDVSAADGRTASPVEEPFLEPPTSSSVPNDLFEGMPFPQHMASVAEKLGLDIPHVLPPMDIDDDYGAPSPAMSPDRSDDEIMTQPASVPAAPPADVEVPQSPAAPEPDETTIVQNEEESFALAPIEASVVRDHVHKPKRKRKLVVDEVKNIPGDEMKAQLSDTSDIVVSLDLAPPTRRLMHWKETGGVEKLFALPGRAIPSKSLMSNYTRHLTSRASYNDEADRRPRYKEDDEELIEQDELAVVTPKRGRKRKLPPLENSQMQPIPEQEEIIPEPQIEKVQEVVVPEVLEAPEQTAPEQMEVDPAPIPEPQLEIVPEQPAEVEAEAQPHAAEDQMVISDQPETNFEEQQPDANVQSIADQSFFPLGEGIQNSTMIPEKPVQTNFFDNFMENDPLAPLTEDIPNQNAQVANGSTTPWHDTDYDNPLSVPPPDEQAVGETDEQFEERVVNKRAAQLYNVVKTKMQRSEDERLVFEDLIRNNVRKQVAQKFYSLLVLKKVSVLELEQRSSFGDIYLTPGRNYDNPRL